MPNQFCRLSEVEIANVGDRVIADFQVGICLKEIDFTVEALVDSGVQNPSVRILRGLNATVEKMQLGQMFPSYGPRIEMLGDPGNFDGSVKYRLSLYSSFSRRSTKLAWEVMKSLFVQESLFRLCRQAYRFKLSSSDLHCAVCGKILKKESFLSVLLFANVTYQISKKILSAPQ